ncbi:MAG: hypothetical protein ACOYOB_19250 [Myxococcota bacterium]
MSPPLARPHRFRFGLTACVVACAMAAVAAPDANAGRKAQRAFMTGGVPTKLFGEVEEESDLGNYARGVAEGVVQTEPSPQTVARDVSRCAKRVAVVCADAHGEPCPAAVATLDLTRPREAAASLAAAATNTRSPDKQAAFRALAVAIQVDLGDLPTAVTIAEDSVRSSKGRERIAALWQLQAVHQRAGDPKSQVLALQRLLQVATGRSGAVDAVCAMEVLAELQETAGDAAAAARTWRKLLKHFEKMRLPKDGAPAAYAAAHAQHALLLPAHLAFLAEKWPDVKLPPLEFVQQTYQRWLTHVFGPERCKGRGENRSCTRKGGDLERWFQPARYGAKEWAYWGCVRAAECIIDYAKKVYSTPLSREEEKADRETGEVYYAYDGYGRPIEDRAFRLLSIVHEDAQRLGLSTPASRAADTLLNRYQPKQIPLLKEERRLQRDGPPTPSPSTE